MRDFNFTAKSLPVVHVWEVFVLPEMGSEERQLSENLTDLFDNQDVFTYSLDQDKLLNVPLIQSPLNGLMKSKEKSL